MLFSSISFIFVFLPALIILCLLTKKEFHNLILLIASIIFYALGDARYLPVMFGIILINYIGALLIDKFKFRGFILALTVILNLSILCYFKYFNFFIEVINNFRFKDIDSLNIILPLGISFYTFQAMSYITDVYRKEVKVQKNLYKLALYICLFPQLIAGPIVKYHDIYDQIENREIRISKLIYGIKRFIIGLSKKVIIANTLGNVADIVFSQPPDTLTPLISWMGALFYSLQIYFDFSGYSDMVIGLGLIFGFKFLENFNYPYISKSITEFWRRWHISLSSWFKQYVYIPLGGNKNGKFKMVENLIIVFLLTGFWHGANWTFIFWGVYNGFFIIVEKLTGFDKEFKNVFINFIKHFYTIFIFTIGWVIFRAEDLKYAKGYIKNMLFLTTSKPIEITYKLPYYLNTKEIVILIIALLCAAPLFSNILNIQNKIGKICINIWLLGLFIISTMMIAESTYNPFIYFRF